MAHWLREFPILQMNPGSIPSTHITRLTSTYNSRSQGSNTLCYPLEHLSPPPTLQPTSFSLFLNHILTTT